MITLFKIYKIEENQTIKSNKAIAYLRAGQKLMPLSEVDLISKIMPNSSKIYLLLMNGHDENINFVTYTRKILNLY